MHSANRSSLARLLQRLALLSALASPWVVSVAHAAGGEVARTAARARSTALRPAVALDSTVHVLVLDDGAVTSGVFSKQVPADPSGKGSVTRVAKVDAGVTSASLIASTLSRLGCQVTVEPALTSSPATWPTYSLVVSASGTNWSPLSTVEYRNALRAFVAAGHRLIIEGGEVGFAVSEYGGYYDPDFGANVLHMDWWQFDQVGSLVLSPSAAGHPLASLPNVLPDSIGILQDRYTNQDGYTLRPGAEQVYGSEWGSAFAQVSVHDDDLDPTAGQVVVFSFAMDAVVDTTIASQMIENACHYLLAEQTPATASLAGTLHLGDTGNGVGVPVTLEPLGRTVVTGSDGTFVFEGLHAGTYRLSARAVGFAGRPLEVTLADGEAASVLFELPSAKATVLVIDDDEWTTVLPRIAVWLEESGYSTVVESFADTDTLAWASYPLVVSTNGRTSNPYSSEAYRSALLSHVRAGRKLLVEGGELGMDGYNDPTFAAEVLRMEGFYTSAYVYEFVRVTGAEDHPMLRTPNLLPERFTIEAHDTFRHADAYRPTPGTLELYSAPTSGLDGGSVFAHDDDVAPQAGQIAIFSLALGTLPDSLGKPMVENAVAYLLASQPEPTAVITGHVELGGAMSGAGTVVTLLPGEHTTTTDGDGAFRFDRLFPTPYKLVCSAPGFARRTATVDLAEGDSVDVLLHLNPAIGHVLVFDEEEEVSPSASAKQAPPGFQQSPVPSMHTSAGHSADRLSDWLGSLDYEVTVSRFGGEWTLASLLDHDLVVYASGSRPYPFWDGMNLQTSQVSLLQDYVAAGGKLIVEGGAVASMAEYNFPDFKTQVLHMQNYAGDFFWGAFQSEVLPHHPVATTPHALPILGLRADRYPSSEDVYSLLPGARLVYEPDVMPGYAGVSVFDDDIVPQAGQIVVLPFDIKMLASPDTAQYLVENSVAYLLANQPEPTAVIRGRLEVEEAWSGAGNRVDLRTSAGYRMTTTDAEGYFSFPGLPSGEYSVSARLPGLRPDSVTVTLADGDTADIVLHLRTPSGILVLDDDGFLASPATKRIPDPEHKGSFKVQTQPASRAKALVANRIATLLEGLGHTVTVEPAASSDTSTWRHYDFVVSSSGANTDPVNSWDYRTKLVRHVSAGRKLLVEGGEVGYVAAYSEEVFRQQVMHMAYWHDDYGGPLVQRAAQAMHPLARVPNILPGSMALNYVGYGSQDVYRSLNDAQLLYGTNNLPLDAGLLVYDDDTAPQSGQIVIYPFDFNALADTSVARRLLQNTAHYLLAQQPMANATLNGHLDLDGVRSGSGATVTLQPGGRTTTTDAQGEFSFTGLLPGTYRVSATVADFVGLPVEVTLTEGGTSSVVLDWRTQVAIQRCVSPALFLPDYPAPPVDNSLFVDGNLSIMDMSVTVNITHTWVGDLVVSLIHDGVTVPLHNRTGGALQNLIGIYPKTLVPAGDLGAFRGMSAAGTWTLRVQDQSGGDAGMLNSWCLDLMGTSSSTVGDTTRPAVQFTGGPEEGALVLADSVTIAWAASDDVTPADSIRYRLLIDGKSGAFDFLPAPQIALLGLQEGPHTLQVEALDLAGNYSVPIVRQFTSRWIPPTLLIDAPFQGSWIAADTVQLQWRVVGRSPLSNPDSILCSVSVDGAPFDTPGRDSTRALPGLGDGAHAIVVRAQDETGLSSTASLSFSVDRVAPILTSVDGPEDGRYVAGGISYFVYATDDQSDSWHIHSEYRVDDGPWVLGGTVGSYSTSVVVFTNDLPSGLHRVDIRVRDLAGNRSTTVLTRTFLVDRTPPETYFVSGPADSAVVTLLPVVFRFSATDDQASAEQLRLSHSTDDLFGIGIADTALQITYPSLWDGRHVVRASAVDLAGNNDPSPVERVFYLDTQGPTLSLTSGPAASTCVSSASIRFEWTATDAVTPLAGLRFSYSLDGAPFSAFSPERVADFGALADGAHEFTLRALDPSGHLTTQTRSFSVDRTSPTVLVPTARVLNTNTIRFQCSGADNIGVTAYRLQVSSSPLFVTVLADVELGSGGMYDFTGTPGGIYYGRALALDCPGNMSAFSASTRAASLANLSNLVASAVSAPPSVTSGTPLTIEYTVANAGLGAASVPEWYDEVLLSPTASYDPATAVSVARVRNRNYLNPGEEYRGSATFTVPIGTSGGRYLIVRADVDDVVPESNGADNVSASSLFPVTLGAYANLVPLQVVAPPTALTEESIHVTWKVRNTGSGRTDAADWWDTVILSSDPVFDYLVQDGNRIRVLDTPVAQFHRHGALERDSSYTGSADFRIPADIPGPLYVIVASDLYATDVNQSFELRGRVFENLDELDASVSDSISITVQAPPDLVVSSVVAPTVLLSGTPALVKWTVRNEGFRDLEYGGWLDRVYLSADSLFDGGDLEIGSVWNGGALPLGESYSRQGTFPIPNGLNAVFRVLVRTDAQGQIREYREDNNLGVSRSALNVSLAPTPNLVVTGGSAPDTVVAGGLLTFAWTVGNFGSGATTTGWYDRVYIGDSRNWQPWYTVAAGASGPSQVLVGGSYMREDRFSIPAHWSGRVYLFAVTDAGNSLYEGPGDSDNLALIDSVQVKPYPVVDLAVSDLQWPPTGHAGDPITIGYRVTNQGEAPTLNSWQQEEVWLSADSTFSPSSDLRLLAPGHSGVIASGETYTRSWSPVLPNGLSGSFHLIVLQDANGYSGDRALADNVAISSGTIDIVSDLPPNLVIGRVTVDAASIAGQPLDIEWAVHNTGTGPVPGRVWYTSAYLSIDPYLDGSDFSLGGLVGSSALAAGDSLVQTLHGNLPAWASGPYYLLVIADSRNDVYEGMVENDNLTRGVTDVTLPLPSDLIVTNVTVPPDAVPGEPVTITYTLSNIGENPASGRLENAVFMSRDTSFLAAEDPLVGIESRFIDLMPGEAAQLSVTVTPLRPIQVDLAGNVTGLLPPLAPGDYHALVRVNIRNNIRESNDANNRAVSSVTVHADMANLAVGGQTVFTLAPDQARYHRIVTTAGLDLRIEVQSDRSSATNELLVAYGRVPTTDDFDFSGPAGFTANPSVVVPSTRAGDYYVVVQARNLGPATPVEQVTLRATSMPFEVASIAPDHGGIGGKVTVRVRGAALRDSTIFTLDRTGGPPNLSTTGTIVRYVNSTEVFVQFDLEGLVAGGYTVTAHRYRVVRGRTIDEPAGRCCFQVEPLQAAAVSIETQQNEFLRRTAVGQFRFTFRNTSNQDVPLSRARLMFPASAVLRSVESDPGFLRRSQVVPGAPDLHVQVNPVTGDSLAFLDLACGLLAPDETRSITVGISNFVISPFSVRAFADALPLERFLELESWRIEEARQALVNSGAALTSNASALAGNAVAFRDSALMATWVRPGLLPEEVFLLWRANHALLELHRGWPGVLAPTALLDSLAAGVPCVVSGPIPECRPDQELLRSALPACISVFQGRDPVLLRLSTVSTDTLLPSLSHGDVTSRALDGTALLVSTSAGSARGFSATASADVKIVVPCDPNLLTGPAGFGPERWINLGAPMQYRVDFENLPGVASAPAQVVRISVPLDANLDPSTFRLGNIGFRGTKLISMPAFRTSYSAQPVYSDLNLAVRVTAGINLATRTATWTLTTIDPATGQQPVNPYIGFLPVNDPSGAGTGFVLFTIQPYATTPSGTTITEQGSIQFDANAPLLTPTASNRIDNLAPSSAVLTSVAAIDPTHVRVRWNGADDPSGAGLSGVALFMRQDSNAFTQLAGDLKVTQLDVPVASGHSYGFFSVAQDNAGNAEALKTAAEGAITIGVPALDSGEPSLPRVTALLPNYPNPFRGSTNLRFDLAQKAPVTIEVFDVQGRLVKRPMSGRILSAGRHVVALSGLPRGPGLYFYRFRAGDYEKTSRLIQLR